MKYKLAISRDARQRFTSGAYVTLPIFFRASARKRGGGGERAGVSSRYAHVATLTRRVIGGVYERPIKKRDKRRLGGVTFSFSSAFGPTGFFSSFLLQRRL